MTQHLVLDNKWEVYRIDQAGNFLFTGLIVQAPSHDKAHKLAANTFKTISHMDLKVRLRRTEDEPKKGENVVEHENLDGYDIKRDFRAFDMVDWEFALNRMRDVGIGGTIMVRSELKWCGPAWMALVDRVFEQRKTKVLGIFENENMGEAKILLVDKKHGITKQGVRVLRELLPDESVRLFDLGVEIGLSCT